MKRVPLKTCQCLLMLVSHQVHQRLSVHRPRTIGTHLILTTLHAHTRQLSGPSYSSYMYSPYLPSPMSCFTQPLSSTWSPAPVPQLPDRPYIVCLLINRILKKCQGCGSDFC